MCTRRRPRSAPGPVRASRRVAVRQCAVRPAAGDGGGRGARERWRTLREGPEICRPPSRRWSQRAAPGPAAPTARCACPQAACRLPPAACRLPPAAWSRRCQLYRLIHTRPSIQVSSCGVSVAAAVNPPSHSEITLYESVGDNQVYLAVI